MANPDNLFVVLQILLEQQQAYADIFDAQYLLKSHPELVDIFEQAQDQPETPYGHEYLQIVQCAIEAAQKADKAQMKRLRRGIWITSGWMEAIRFTMQSQTDVGKLRDELFNTTIRLLSSDPGMQPSKSMGLFYEGYFAGLTHCLEMIQSGRRIREN